MKDSARYVKIVEWSEEDQCYVGSSPGLLYGGCHGDDEKQVFDEASPDRRRNDCPLQEGQQAAASTDLRPRPCQQCATRRIARHLTRRHSGAGQRHGVQPAADGRPNGAAAVPMPPR